MNTIDETLIKKDREIEKKGGGNAETHNLRELMLAELKTIYWAEQQLTNAIPIMMQKATSENLKTALAHHFQETKDHVKRLEAIFNEELEIAPEAKKCDSVWSMISEAGDLIEKSMEGSVRDAAIIAAAQKVEHFEIATYGTLLTFANTMGETKIAAYFKETLDEEYGADDKLTEIAKMVNPVADKEDPNRIGKFRF